MTSQCIPRAFQVFWRADQHALGCIQTWEWLQLVLGRTRDIENLLKSLSQRHALSLALLRSLYQGHFGRCACGR
eukprot:4678121-Pleurochrysis_carterae.AAC.2